jgi:molybdopterin-guanine dinucleotide biosynthesis protein B
MHAVLLAGHKKSGKTQLAISLCEQFREWNIPVAVAKYSHHSFDRPDSDTGRLASVADHVLAFDPDTASLIQPGKRSLQDFLPLISARVLIIEGGKHLENLPRIILPRQEDNVEELDNGLGIGQWTSSPAPGMYSLSDTAQAARLILERGFLLPDLDCAGCGRETCAELARDIVAGRAEISECTSLSSPSIQVTVNGATLPLNPFVQDILRNTLTGILSALKGGESGKVEISLDI